MAASTNRSESNHREKVQKVFIQRDYSEGTSVKFQTKFPPELEGLIDRHIFEQTINTLNRIYAEAEKTSTTTFCEGCLACLTSYVIYLCIETHYEKCLKRISAYLDDQNETVWLPKGLLITDPIERGLRVIEIAILPQNAPSYSGCTIVMPRLAEGICTQLTSAVIARCKASKIFTVDDFIFQDPESLSKEIGTAFKDVLLIRDALLLKFAPVLRRADSLLCEVLDTLAIFETGSKRINNALQGGVYTGEVTEIHGPPGSGKTQFCLDVISDLLIKTSCTVLYMDSNCTFSAGRVEEILLQKSDDCIVLSEKLQRIRVINMYDVYNFLDILYYVEKELQKKENIFYKNLKLLIVDSITHILAPCFGGPFLDGSGMISIVSELFNVICSKYTLSIMVCNNTVQGNGLVIKPALGGSWKHVPSVSLCIQNINDTERRKLSAVKSCRTGLFKDIPFCIGKCGISN